MLYRLITLCGWAVAKCFYRASGATQVMLVTQKAGIVREQDLKVWCQKRRMLVLLSKGVRFIKIDTSAMVCVEAFIPALAAGISAVQ